MATIVAQPEIGQTVEAAGIRTNYHDQGEGAPVVLVHGSGPGVHAWANWRLNMPELAKSFRVLAPDMLAFGYTEPPKGRITDKAVWVRHLLGFLDAMKLDKVSLVGNSFGGAITLAFMIAHPDRVERAVLMGAAALEFPITKNLDDVWGYEPSLETMRKSLFSLAWDPARVTEDLIRSRYEASARPEAHKPYSETFGPQPRQDHIKMLASREEDVARLPHEVLLLHGKLDSVIPPELSIRLGNLIKNSDVHMFGNCGHWVQIERVTSFNRIVTEFFQDGLKA
jgi:2-hydroxymuconate-semialdehyde hydrolase